MTGPVISDVQRDLKSSFKADIDINYADAEADVDMDRYFGCLKGGSKSVQVLFDGIEAVMVYVVAKSHERPSTILATPGCLISSTPQEPKPLLRSPNSF